MPYTAEISRANPTCFVFVLDQSGSMAETIAGSTETKAAFLADVVNRTLQDLVIRCAKGEEVRNYFYVATLGYGSTVGSRFAGSLSGRTLVPISDVAEYPLRVESRTKKVPDGAGGLVEQTVRFPVWVD